MCSSVRSRAVVSVSRRAKYGLRAIALIYVFVLVVIPMGVITTRTLRQGLGAFWDAISSPQAVSAFRLTATVTVWAVVLNTIFGVGVAILLTRYRFPGKRLMSALIDIPIAISPIVVGLALVLVYGPYNGWFGKSLHSAGFEVIY